MLNPMETMRKNEIKVAAFCLLQKQTSSRSKGCPKKFSTPSIKSDNKYPFPTPSLFHSALLLLDCVYPARDKSGGWSAIILEQGQRLTGFHNNLWKSNKLNFGLNTLIHSLFVADNKLEPKDNNSIHSERIQISKRSIMC